MTKEIFIQKLKRLYVKMPKEISYKDKVGISLNRYHVYGWIRTATEESDEEFYATKMVWNSVMLSANDIWKQLK